MRDGDRGLTVLALDTGEPRIFELQTRDGGDARTGVRRFNCAADGEVVSELARPVDSNEPMLVVQWQLSDGRLVRPEPVGLGGPSGDAEGLAAVDETGPLFFVFRQERPHVEAYRIGESGSGEQLDARALDTFGGPTSAFPVGSFTLGDRLLLLYSLGGVLSVIPFSREKGFGTPVLVTDAGCSRGAGERRLPNGTFLPCANGTRLSLLSMCRSGP